MSANNQLIILKQKGKFSVHMNYCVDNEFKPSKNSLLKEFSTLKEAIKYSNEYCREYPYVEYGYTICDSCLK